MAIVKLVDKQRYRNEEILNIYHFNGDGGDVDMVDLAELASEFMANVMPNIIDTQHANVEHTDLYLTALDTELELRVPLANINGQNSGEELPTFVAWYFQMNRTTKITRSGRKSIGGISESSLENSEPSVNAQGHLDDLEIALALPLLVPTSAQIFYPSIVRYANGIPVAANTVSTASYRYVSTQNTRKQRA